MCPYLVYCDDCNCIALPLSIPFVFVSRPSMDEAEKYQQRLQAIVVRTSLCFFSVFTFALLPTTSVCLKPTWPPTSCQNNLTAATSSHVTSVERSRLICTAWSEHAKNIPRLTFWPVFSELWNERLQGLSGCCLTSLECKKNLPKHEWPTSAETARAQSGPQHVLELTLTVQIQCQHACNVLRHWTISLGIPALLPAVSACCNLSVTSPKNIPSLPLDRSRNSAFTQKKSLSSGTMTAEGCYQRIILKSGCYPP